MSAGTRASAGIEAKGTFQAEKNSDAERPLSN